ncbi:MAG: restriction endonuclease subunit R [Cyanothece sp. SIO2G6]|nr:restriction endonuclease subunit R [Cyanothece sp. SIO2G6]
MVQTVAVGGVDLAQLAEKFGLKRSDAPDFFREWRDELPELSEGEEGAVAEIKADYLYLSRYDLQKSVAKLVVLSPLLQLVGLYRPPFHFVVDEKIELETDDDGMTTALLHILAMHPRLWLTIVEATYSKYSVAIAIPQTLSVMMEKAQPGEVVFGLVSNGQEFQFLKLLKTETPIYALSYTLCLNREDDLQRVAQILKALSQWVTREV